MERGWRELKGVEAREKQAQGFTDDKKSFTITITLS